MSYHGGGDERAGHFVRATLNGGSELLYSCRAVDVQTIQSTGRARYLNAVLRAGDA